jgi:hypothetical protein
MNNKKTISKNSERVVRATFSLPGSALDEIESLRAKLALDGHLLNKSEVVRIGLMALDGLTNKNAKKIIVLGSCNIAGIFQYYLHVTSNCRVNTFVEPCLSFPW